MLNILNKFDLRIAIKTGVAASCSLFIAKSYSHFFSRPEIFISGLWCVVTTIVVMQANVGSTYKAGGIRFLGIIVGSVLGALACQFVEVSILSLGVSVAAAILLCSILNLKEAYRIAGLSVAVVMVSWTVHPEANPWVISFFRSLDATVGILIAIIISHLVWPEQTWLAISNQFLKSLQVAKTCYHDAVKILGPKTKVHNLNELSILLAKLHADLDDTKLDFFSFEKRESWILAAQSLDRLAESIGVVQEIPKENLANIFDQSLSYEVEKFIEETQTAFEELQSLCMAASYIPYSDRLKEQERLLTEDLERFRNARLTRNFSLSDVENFYSYFYHLHFVARQLYAIESQLNKDY